MKKVFYIAAMAALAISCAKEIEGPETANYVQRTYTAIIADDGTKTALGEGGAVSWKAGDKVRYYSKANGEVGEFTVAEDGANASLNLDVADDARFLVAAYGGESITGNTSGNVFTLNGAVKAEQSGKFSDAHVSVVKTYDVNQTRLTFSNVTSLVKFTLERTDVSYITFSSNDNTAIHGSGVLSFTFTDETPSVSLGSTTGSSIKVTVGAAGTYYISTLPATLATGFTIKCYDASDSYIGIVKSEKITALEKNTVLNLGTLDSRIQAPSDPDKPTIVYEPNLSKDGTANCYIVPIAGEYYFDATVKGSSSETISGNAQYADVLWESFGTATAPEVGDIVKNARYENGKVYFTATGKNGNAAIAVTNRDDEVLWSWHIWCCMDYDADFYAQEYNNNAGTMMDRNLGATSAKPGDVRSLGLLYQWGRKDPFLGSASISSGIKAASTVTWPSAENAWAHLCDNNTLAYATANPTVFLKNGSDPYDWYCTSSTYRNYNLWTSTKTVYDPCPAGYRVPDGLITGIWSKAFGTGSYWKTSSNWDSTNKGMDFGSTDKTLGTGTIWYPASGYLTYYSGALYYVGDYGYYWSCTPGGSGSPRLDFSSNGSVYPSINSSRAYGQSVRCCKDENYKKPVSIIDLSTDGTANCYIVSNEGTYKFKIVQGNTETPVGAVASASVLWESFGTDTAPSVGDLVTDATYADGYITFKASDKKGNAVIAAKDDDGNILWSWHIWLTDKPVDQIYNNDAGTMMDCNLGATSAKPGDVGALGLLYQWGRKDPFLGGCSISFSSSSNQTKASSTITWPEPENASDHLRDNNTIAYAIANPTVFLTSSALPYDWYCTSSTYKNDSLWSATKTTYDPCPTGYRVPTGGSIGIWSKAFGISYDWQLSSYWDSNSKGMDFGSTDRTLGTGIIWYPASGYLNYSSGTLYNVGARSDFWSCSQNGYYAYSLGIGSSGYVYPSDRGARAYGRSVRCQKIQ